MRALRSSLFIGAALFCQTGCLKKSEPFLVRDINNAPDHLKEDRLEFQGEVHPEFAGSYEWRSSGTQGTKTVGVLTPKWKHVIPVTGADWKKRDQVPLWITFSSFGKDVRAETRALQAAVREGTVVGVFRDFPEREAGVLRGVSPWQNAVRDAEKRHGLKSHPRAPIVSWSP